MAAAQMSQSLPLTGRRIALLETREAERLAAMFREQGAEVVVCSSIKIIDVADPAPVLAWIDRFIEHPADDLILLTGEGLARLYALAQKSGNDIAFIAALRQARTIIRGPKPARALRSLGLEPQLRTREPTTEGVVAMLSGLQLRGRRVGVQLYPGASDRIPSLLREAVAAPDVVTPYDYAPNASEEALQSLIDELVGGRFDAIAFTSAAQVRRLFETAQRRNREIALATALRKITVAAVGPIVAAEIERVGLAAKVVPHDAYFMKPLVTAVSRMLSVG